jgi:hypothetical protein
MTHLPDDRQITMFSPHAHEHAEFYEQTGPIPPPNMTVEVKGTMMAADRSTSRVDGTLEVTDWIKADHSPNPERYLVTDTWYPNRWHFTFDESVPEDIREFVMTPIVDGVQSGYFANGAQYAEGAVVITAPDGTELGRGFAESVSYANTRRIEHQLAGLPDTDEHIASLSLSKVPTTLAVANAAYVLMNQERLQEVFAESAGMEFFLPPGQRPAAPTGE